MGFAGIDAGNSRMKVAIPDPQGNPVVLPNASGELYTPSAVYFEGERTVVGKEAVNGGLLDPERLCENWKRFMGSDQVLYKDPEGREYTAPQILRILLEDSAQNFTRYTGDILTEAVISVPANYTDRQKRETEQAANEAGIRVPKLIHEPTAAALGNRVTERGDGLVVIFDLGGGTFDISLVRVVGNSLSVLASSGEPHLGGQDFNERLKDMTLEGFRKKFGFSPDPEEHAESLQQLAQRVEEVKLVLTRLEKSQLWLSCDGKTYKFEITRPNFAAATRDLVDKAMARGQETLSHAGVPPEELSEIITVGGASQMACFLEAIESRFGKKPAWHADPYYAAALGNVIEGRITKQERGETLEVDGRKLPPIDIHRYDITSHPIGVATIDGKGQQLFNSVILKKGVRMPSEHTRTFQLAEPDQTAASIQLLQGHNGAPIEDCLKLGEYTIEGLPAVSDKPHALDLRLHVDANGLTTSEAYDPLSGKTAKLRVDNYNAKTGEVT